MKTHSLYQDFTALLSENFKGKNKTYLIRRYAFDAEIQGNANTACETACHNFCTDTIVHETAPSPMLVTFEVRQ